MNKLENIIRMQKLSKFGNHLSGLFHNLNTPLMGISGRLELLSFTNPDLKGLSQMTEQLDRIEAIMNNFASIYENDKKNNAMEIDLNKVVDSVDTFYHTNLKYKHKLNVEKSLGDIAKISINISNVQNLLISIIKYILVIVPENGKLMIETKTIENNVQLGFIVENVELNSELINDLNNKTFESFSEDEDLFFVKYYLSFIESKYRFSLDGNNLIVKIIF